MSNLAVRLLTALVGIPIILAILYLAPAIAYFTLVGAGMLVASVEFFGMSHPGDRTGQILGAVLSTGLFILLVATDFGRVHSSIAVGGCIALAPIALLFSLVRPAEIPNALSRTSALVMGPMYIGASMAALALLRVTAPTAFQGAGLVVMSLMFAWFSDTGGYFFGKGLKGPKLYPAVSPNKTWSGAVGGVLGSMLGAVFAHFVFLRTLPLGAGLAVAALAGAYGQAGDFCESVLKRSAGVKDSGGILPGHGGILDRIDALMFVAVAVYLALRAGWLTLLPGTTP